MQLLLLLVSLGLSPASAGKPKRSKVELVSASDLGLPAPPTTAARLEITGEEHSYAGPARLELLSTDPLHLRLHDLAEAEPVEILVESASPARLGLPPGATWTDTGSVVVSDDKLLLSLQRAWPDGRAERIVVVGRVDPQPMNTPRGWLEPGTTLFYGITLDDKPITRQVPLGLMVTIEAALGGARSLAWKGDVDPDAQVDDTTLRAWGGRRLIAAEVAERGVQHSDRFTVPGEQQVETTSLFASRQARRTLTSMGAAAWQDQDIAGSTLLRAVGQTELIVQADDALWRVPATAARADGDDSLYVIASDEQDPLILYARRPGWTLQLLAIGRPGH